MRGARLLVAVGIVPALMVAAACADAPTSTKPNAIWAMQARWQARQITSYQYEFNQGAFFNACPRPVRVYVGAGSVDSAFAISTGDKLAPAMLQMCAVTIDGLFSRALSAAASGTLTKIRYDARYGYVAEMVISGPPDAGGFLAASSLEPK